MGLIQFMYTFFKKNVWIKFVEYRLGYFLLFVILFVSFNIYWYNYIKNYYLNLRKYYKYSRFYKSIC